jgi:tripartite-type tricarboxylate transporter receptor subunit TctC
MTRIKFLRKVLFLVWLIGLAAVPSAWPAEPSWPAKDITVIVPFSPGGGYDLQSRIFAPIWENKLPRKANVVVMNKRGAGGKIGVMELMKSAPDGYTIGTLSPSALALMQVSGDLGNMDIRQLGWLGLLSWEDGAVVVSTASGIKTVEDLKKRELRFGVDEDSMFPAAMLAKQLGLKARMVLFDGTAESNLALIRGDIDARIDSVSGSKRGVINSQGKIIPLFTVSEKRAPDWPEVPSSKELGMELGDLKYIAGSARALAAPAGIPAALLKTMQDTAWGALQDPAFKTGMEKAAFTSSPGTAVDASKTVSTILKVLEENKNVLESLKKR